MFHSLFTLLPHHPHPAHLAPSPLSDHLHARPQQAAHRQVQGGGTPENPPKIASKSAKITK